MSVFVKCWGFVNRTFSPFLKGSQQDLIETNFPSVVQVNPILRDCSAQSKRRGKPLNMQNVYLPFSPIIHLHFYFLCFKSLLWQFSQLTLERQLQQWNNLFLNLFGWDCALEFLKVSFNPSDPLGEWFKYQIKSNEF